MDVFDLVAKLTLDSSGYSADLDNAESKASTFGSKLKSGLGVAAKVGAAAVAAVGTAAVAMGKQALDAYADYEQLEGGIQTLYGENSEAAKQMMQQASEAWKTAGMSANEYMEMAIESSAALISSLGGDTEEAARLMDVAIVDMSDNVNKMGTSMESIQNAYRGFSRGNFTMLDNLALGFAGTKEGMQQLLDKAEEYAAKNGEVRDFSIDSYADIVEAIHIVQEEMGIAGTTAAEASDTISGSLNATKAAWQNLLTGIADENANFDQLVNDFVDSVVTTAGNIIPRVQSILQGLAKLITESSDKILPIVIDTIVQNLPMIVETGVKLIVALITGLIKAIPQIVAAIPTIIRSIWDGFKAGWPQLRDAGSQLLEMLASGLLNAAHAAVNAAVNIGDQIFNVFREIAASAWTWGVDLIGNFISGIVAKAGELWETVKGIANGVKNFLGFSEPKEGPLSDFHTYAPDMMELFAKGIRDNEGMLKNTVASAFNFGNMTTNSVKAVPSVGSNGAADEMIPIVVQCILDGKVISENVTKWQRRTARAAG